MKTNLICKLYILFYLIYFINAVCKGQENEIIPLSQTQMYEDFDQFVRILEDANPQLPIRKAMTNIDQLEAIKLLRSSIPTTNNYYNFISLLNVGLGYLYDIHAVMATQFYEQLDDTTEIDSKIISKIAYGYSQWGNEIYDSMLYQEKRWFPCNPSYIDGDYYLHGNYYLITKKYPYDTIILKDAKILLYNNRSYHDYVIMSLAKFAKGSIRWDYQRKQYYSKLSSFSTDNQLIVENSDGKTDSIDLNAYNFVVYHLSDLNLRESGLRGDADFVFIHPNQIRKKVLYFPKDNLLYIYLNSMSINENELAEEVKTTGRNKEINKIVIDVRGNRGGSDMVWHQLLKAIVYDTLAYDAQMAFCNSELMNKHLGKQFTDTNNVECKTFSWLPDISFSVTKFTTSYFIPDSNSLKYKGKIYVLQDEDVFSAGHSLTSYCRHIEQLISVGVPTGLMSGFGLNPILFQLKHSKFSFRLEPAIDVTDAKKAEDVYQDIPEILIEIPFEEQIKLLDYRFFDMQNEKCLYTYDYLFQKILEME
jgi:hypothetical protein